MINIMTGIESCTRCNYVGCRGGIVAHYRFAAWITGRNLRKRFHAWKHSFTDFDYSKISDIDVASIKMWDMPDFSDAYIHSATYKGKPMTEAQLERLNDDRGFVYDQVIARIY